jgi:Zn-dependent protease with chaperone function
VDFYSAQAAARRRSGWLVLALLASVALVVAALTLVTVLVFAADGSTEAVAGIASSAALLWLLIILGASAYKGLVLRGGGGVVARALGGTRVDRDVSDPLLRRLRNVVEEMAIASGVPVPEVYVLEGEAGLNAFAAGHSPANAAVAVTRGTVERLSRDELQGVVAHEFSHILNGDMRLNIRLMGWLFGLLAIGSVGRFILRATPRRSREAGALIALGAAMFVLGYVGLFLGRLIQAAVSRQREWLADASAVQFTRNPAGLRGALLLIAGSPVGGRLSAAAADEVAHLLFVQGLSRAFATHPPLDARIAALSPGSVTEGIPRQAAEAWAATERRLAAASVNPTPVATSPTVSGDADSASVASRLEAVLAPVVASVAAAPAAIADRVGNPGTLEIARARQLRLALPPELRAIASVPARARGLMLAVIAARDPTRRGRQVEVVGTTLGATVRAEVEAAEGLATGLPLQLRLPAIQELFPALRRLPRAERVALAGLLGRLAEADGRIDVFEFCLGRLVFNALLDELESRDPHGLRGLATSQRALGVLFSVLARHGAPADDGAARAAFDAGIRKLALRHPPGFGVPEAWPRELWGGLSRIQQLFPAAKRAVVEALVETISHDGRLSVDEAELLRTACALLQCPLPPLLPVVERPAAP